MSSERRGGWVAAALGVSLALNLFLGGLVSGRLFTNFDLVRVAAARAPGFVARFRALPSDDRAKFGAAYEPHRHTVNEARQMLQAARLSAFGALGAPIYDKQVMQQDFDAVLQATRAAQTAVHGALVDAFATLSQHSRATLAGAERPEGP